MICIGTEYREVRILEDLPFEFKGTDLKTYGHYEEGDIVELPKDNADILVNRGKAELGGGDRLVHKDCLEDAKQKGAEE